MAPRNRLLRPLLVGATILTVLAALGLVGLVSFGVWQLSRPADASDPRNRVSALKTTREWARLAPFPVPDSAIDLRIQGSAFTRQFIVKFRAPAGDVERWMAASPGLQGAKPIPQPDGSLRFSIQPGGGAQTAEVFLSKDGTQVTIDTWWS